MGEGRSNVFVVVVLICELFQLQNQRGKTLSLSIALISLCRSSILIGRVHKSSLLIFISRLYIHLAYKSSSNKANCPRILKYDRMTTSLLTHLFFSCHPT